MAGSIEVFASKVTMLNNICASSWKHAKKIRKSTNYLFQKLGISYFGMQRITAGGHWSLVTNHPAWVEHSADKKFYLHDPTLVNPDYYEAGHSFISAHANPEFQNTLIKSAAQFDIAHCLALVNKVDQDGEFAFFATSPSNTHIINTYISQFKLLHRFIHYFKSENKQAFQDASEHSINLKQLKKDAYSNHQNVVNCTPDKSNIELDSIFYHLSKRETQCLHFLLEGKTAKEIAKKLSLSPRTVEEYIANLKRKSNCYSLHDLLVLFQDRL